jgi:hypothetical protein
MPPPGWGAGRLVGPRTSLRPHAPVWMGRGVGIGAMRPRLDRAAASTGPKEGMRASTRSGTGERDSTQEPTRRPAAERVRRRKGDALGRAGCPAASAPGSASGASGVATGHHHGLFIHRPLAGWGTGLPAAPLFGRRTGSAWQVRRPAPKHYGRIRTHCAPRRDLLFRK